MSGIMESGLMLVSANYIIGWNGSFITFFVRKSMIFYLNWPIFLANSSEPIDDDSIKHIW